VVNHGVPEVAVVGRGAEPGASRCERLKFEPLYSPCFSVARRAAAIARTLRVVARRRGACIHAPLQPRPRGARRIAHRLGSDANRDGPGLDHLNDVRLAFVQDDAAKLDRSGRDFAAYGGTPTDACTVRLPSSDGTLNDALMRSLLKDAGRIAPRLIVAEDEAGGGGTSGLAPPSQIVSS
jgi:hypothetical protein